MMRARSFIFIFAVAAGIGACDRPQEDPRPMIEKAMKGLVQYPNATVVSMTAGTDAGELNLTSPDSVAQVAQWYRKYLAINGWQLQGDRINADQSVSLYAERGTRPVWITLRPSAGGPGTSFSVMSGIADTSAVARPRGSPQGNRNPTAR
ncbi:MAG TPA: hypothetical protein VI160_11420 [Gemmatimonadales bacterium]